MRNADAGMARCDKVMWRRRVAVLFLVSLLTAVAAQRGAGYADGHGRSNRPARRHDPVDPGPHRGGNVQDFHPGAAGPHGDRPAAGALGVGGAQLRHRPRRRVAGALRPVPGRHGPHRARSHPARCCAADIRAGTERGRVARSPAGGGLRPGCRCRRFAPPASRPSPPGRSEERRPAPNRPRRSKGSGERPTSTGLRRRRSRCRRREGPPLGNRHPCRS